MKKEAIMICKNLVGSYGESDLENIPHEIINEFKDDNGFQYIYIPPYGGFATSKYDIKWVIFTGKGEFVDPNGSEKDYQRLEVKYVVEVEKLLLPKNSGNEANADKRDEQSRMEEVSGIKYGEVNLTNINMINHESNQSDMAFYVTFKAQKVYFPKGKIYMGFGFVSGENDVKWDIEPIHYTDKEGKTREKVRNKVWRQRGYLIRGEGKNYDITAVKIANLIENGVLIPHNNSRFVVNASDNEHVEQISRPSFLKFIGKEYDETAFSNILYSYLKNNNELIKRFLSEMFQEDLKNGNANLSSEQFEIHREYAVTTILKNKQRRGRVDLLFSSSNYNFIIENKIKSDLNGIDTETSTSQLSVYHSYFTNQPKEGKPEVCWTGKNLKKAFFAVLTPNYNQIDFSFDPDMEKKYCTLRYSDLYIFFEREEIKNVIAKNHPYLDLYDHFLVSLKHHSMLYSDEIRARFSLAIKNGKNKQNNERNLQRFL